MEFDRNPLGHFMSHCVSFETSFMMKQLIYLIDNYDNLFKNIKGIKLAEKIVIFIESKHLTSEKAFFIIDRMEGNRESKTIQKKCVDFKRV